MREYQADIIIFGAGIAGLWALKRLSALGYDVLLLEQDSIGAGQTVASQGIIHSGLKYALKGKTPAVAEQISAMPEIWRETFKDDCMAAPSQNLLIKKGMVGKVVKAAAKKMLGNARELEKKEWPAEIRKAGFNGSLIHMDEPVLDIPKVLRKLAEPLKGKIRKLDGNHEFLKDGIRISGEVIKAKVMIFTCGGGNKNIAEKLGHEARMETQARPLVMGLLRNAPFPLFAHFAGASDKPLMTITTHKTTDGKLIWYMGGGVAERAKNAHEREVYADIQKVLAKYLPDVDPWAMEWASLPIDRHEGKSDGKMPDAPVIYAAGSALYCWPTKLTFAPLLADIIVEKIKIKPSGSQSDWAFLNEVSYANAPWDNASWKKFY